MNTRKKLYIMMFAASSLSLPTLVVSDDSPQIAKPDEIANLDTVTVISDTSEITDIEGYDNVYDKNVSGDYKGYDELNAFQVNSAGDVLKGLNNVYNMNTRTAGSSITPNIRGIAGKGRIPVTVDGTEQTVDVWLNNYGVGDRNYLDPSLFGSITVEKGPALTRGVKSGVGGAVAITTINPSDIVPKDKTWGISVKGQFSNNANTPESNLDDYLGHPDYRTLPGGATADGAGGGVNNQGIRSPQALVIDDFPLPERDQKEVKFGDDNAYRIAAAFDTDIADGLVAYSYREKGNFFAGSKGAKGYQNNKVGGLQDCRDSLVADHAACGNADSFIPNTAKIYRPGEEVLNSGTDTKTLLLKNNWKLPKNQKIGWEFMNTSVLFGEIPPMQMASQLRGANLKAEKIVDKQLAYQVPSVRSEIDSKTFKTSYEWKPEDNPLIDLKANAYYVKTKSKRHQSGGMSLAADKADGYYDAWRWVNVREPQGFEMPPKVKETITMLGWRGINLKGMTLEELYGSALYFQKLPETDNELFSNMNAILRPEMGTNKYSKDFCSKVKDFLKENKSLPFPFPAICKDYSVVAGSLQETTATRIGANISNHFQLQDNFGITLSADYEKEKLDEDSQIYNDRGFVDALGFATTITKNAGPRSGKRRVWGADTKINWQATDKLNIQAGIRYDNFTAEDVKKNQAKDNNDTSYAFGGNVYTDEYMSGMTAPVLELQTNKELIKDFKDFKAKYPQSGSGLLELKALNEKHNLKYRDKEIKDSYNHTNQYLYSRTSTGHVCNIKNDEDCGVYRIRLQYTPVKNSKVDSSRLIVGGEKMLREKVDNPNGSNKPKLYKYIVPRAKASDSHPDSGAYDNYLDGYISNYDGKLLKPISETLFNVAGYSSKEYGKAIYSDMTDDMRWGVTPAKINGHAWSPMLSATYDITDNSTIFTRIAQKTRFPSLYEVTSREGLPLTNPLTLPEELKPERSTNFELGYAFNFSPYVENLLSGDVRLTYYNNTIKDVMDTNQDKRIIQFDKKVNTGLELQSRIDTGKYFASMGASYRLKQVICDKDTSASLDIYLRRMPECIEGGYGAAKFFQAVQPKLSINADVGARLLDNDLELGLRANYHSKVENKQYEELLDNRLAYVYDSWTTGKPYHWRSSLTLDAYGNYRMNKNFNVNFGITNITDRYYIDPMSTVPTPGPGRTFTLGLEGKF